MFSLIMLIVITTIIIVALWQRNNITSWVASLLDSKSSIEEELKTAQAKYDALAENIASMQEKRAELARESQELGWQDRESLQEWSRHRSNLNVHIEELKRTLATTKEHWVVSAFKWVYWGVVGFLSFIAINIFIAINSFTVEDGQIKHWTRVLGGADLPAGHYVATEPMTSNPFTGMKGAQADIFTPGFHWFWLIDVMYEELETITLNGAEIDLRYPHSIPKDHFATVSTRDGISMPNDMILAPRWESPNEFLDARIFLTKKDENGKKMGYRGDQFTIITGGTIMANKILYQFQNHRNEEIKTGETGVVRSAINELPEDVCLSGREEITTTAGSVTFLVPKGCAGIWKEDLTPKTYRFHPKAFTITHIPSRQQDFNRYGGYTKRPVSFKVNDTGKIVDVIGNDPVHKPANAEGEAIDVVVEGWTVPIDLLTKYQVVDAPRVVATIGDFEKDRNDQHKIEKFLYNPVEAEFRQIAQGKDILRCAVYEQDEYKGDKLIHREGDIKDLACADDSRKLFDLINNRKEIQSATLNSLNALVEPFGLAITMQTMGHPNLPVESMLPRMRANYAKRLQTTLKEEKATYELRKESEAARVEAEKQDIIVTAQLEKQAADDIKEKRKKLADAAFYEKQKEADGEAYQIKQAGVAQKEADFERAKGQRELVSVMGEALVQEQVLQKQILDAAVQQPDIIKTADMVVSGGANGDLNSMLGTSTMAMFMSELKAKREQNNKKSN